MGEQLGNKLSDPDPKVVMAEMSARATKWYNFLTVTGHLGLVRKSYQTYYSGVFRGGIIRKSGERGEIADLTTADYRNLLNHQNNLVTGGKIKWDVKATNGDFSSQAQALLAPGLLDYYNQVKGANAAAQKAQEFNSWAGCGYVVTKWDPSQGEIAGYDPDTQRDVSTGDVVFQPKNMIDVCIDPTVKTLDQVQWYIVRDYEQIDEMLALYPEHESEIKASIANYDPRREIEDIYSIRARMSITPTTCVVWTLYHERTPSCPNGRIFKMIGNEAGWIEDSPLYTKTAPIARFQTSTIERTPIGYSDAWDILQLQQARDIMIRTIVTNIANTGVVNILNPAGSNINVKQLRGGMSIIEYQPGLEPKALNLEATSANVFIADKLLTNIAQTNIGIGDVQRGNPENGIKAGVALALLQSLSVQYQSKHQRTWATGNEKIGMDLLDTLKAKASTTRKLAIVGKMQGQYISEFSGQDLDGIERVTVDLGNPLTATIAGRVGIAETMAQNGLIKNTDEMMQVMSTGTIEPAIQPLQAENMRIKSENEALLKGENPPVLYLFKHPKDIAEHLALLSTPEALQNPETVTAVTDHVQLHIDLWGQMSMAQPSLLAALGIPPLQQGPPLASPMPPDGMSGPMIAPMLPAPIGPDGVPMDNGAPPGPPPGAGGAPPFGDGEQGPMLPPQPPPPENQSPKPKNPATGKTWSPTGGME